MSELRKELKRPDSFVVSGQQALKWALENQGQLWLAVGGLLAVVAVAAGFNAYGGASTRQANEDLAKAFSSLQAEEYAAAATQFSEVSSRWGATSEVGLVARLYAAQAELRAGNSDTAATTLTALLNEALPEYLRQQVLIGLGVVAEEKADKAAAAAHFKDAVALEGPYRGVALMGEARNRAGLGEKDAAKALYQRFLNEFPESGEKPAAEAALAGLTS